MRARHREARLFLELQPDAIDITAAADACGFQVLELGPGGAQLRCGPSLSSLGENILVSVSAVDRGVLVDVLSESRFPIQIEDPGINVAHTRHLLEALVGQLDETVVVERVPLCTSCGYLLAGVKPHECPECGSKLHDVRLKPRPFGQKVRRAAVIAVLMIAIEAVLAFLLVMLGHFRELNNALVTVGGIRLLLLHVLGIMILQWLVDVWTSNKRDGMGGAL